MFLYFDGRANYNRSSKVLGKAGGCRQDAVNKYDKNYIQNFSQLTFLEMKQLPKLYRVKGGGVGEQYFSGPSQYEF